MSKTEVKPAPIGLELTPDRSRVSRDRNREDIANVLIVDDDPELARFMLEILARKGIRGHLANDKNGAMDFLNKGVCDLVFACDRTNRRAGLSDRARDGFELLREVRANWPELPVIMIAEAETKGLQQHKQTIVTAVKAIRAGCCDFLIKPLDREKVEDLLDN